MNIFILDNDIELCAQYHIDKHVVKMVLETTQLMNNVCILYNSRYIPVYRITHKNHPCSLWAGKSLENFMWLSNLGLALCKEYTYRYGKIHKCQSIIEFLKNSDSVKYMKKIGLTPFEKCMPDQYKTNDAVESYRNYYKADKAYIAKWSKRSVPNWCTND